MSCRTFVDGVVRDALQSLKTSTRRGVWVVRWHIDEMGTSPPSCGVMGSSPIVLITEWQADGRLHRL